MKIFFLLEKSCFKTVIVALCILALGLGMPRANAQVPGVIIDQDLSSDHDDVGDLTVLNALYLTGECKILACICDSANSATPECMDCINTYFGHGSVPCGSNPDAMGPGGYPATIASEFPHTQTNYPDGLIVYRQVLAAAPSNSVIIVTTGFLNMLERLMQSPGDSISPLTGMQLIEQKVKLLACAGGSYPSGGEFNFTVVPDASYYVINHWPTSVPATFSSDQMGQDALTGGAAQNLPLNEPTRAGWELTFWDAYPSWGQQADYFGVRAAESAQIFNFFNIGTNSAATNGVNTWVVTGTPGEYNQAYTLPRAPFPLQEALNALYMIQPPGVAAPPAQPSDIRVTVSGSTLNLQWTRNSYNETGFVIERGTNGVYTQIGTVGAGVTTYADTTSPSTKNISYRVYATGAYGNSPATYIWVYSGWTETDFQNPSALPLYDYYQTCDLDANVTNGPNNHVTLCNDSMINGQNLTINVMVGGIGEGTENSSYIYFFYQNANNWYRLNANPSASWFEKDVNGTITRIGAVGAAVPVGLNVQLQQWRVVVTSSGNLQFLTDWATGENVSPEFATILNVNDTLSFSSGQIGLGGSGSTPVWQNFNFNTLTGVAQPPASPMGVSATPGNGSVTISWSPVSGATGYNVYEAPNSFGETDIPVATNINATSYVNTGLANGTTYYYKVAAVNSTGISSYSYEVSATPGTTITQYFANGTYEIASKGTGMAVTITGANVTPTVVQEPYTGSANQQWTLTNLGNNVVELISVGNGLALDAPGASPVNGAWLGTETYNGGGYQLWQLVSIGGGYYEVINLNSSLSLNIAYGSSQAGIGIIQYAVSSGPDSVFSFTLVSNGPPVITSATTATGMVGSAFSYQITASNGPTSYNATGLPAGLSVNTGSGVISGTPTTAGTNSVIISASNANGTGSNTLTLIVNAAGTPAITSSTTASGTVGSAFSYQITASNSPTNYNATGLPAGLSVNTSSGVISGTPTTAGASSVTISASNANGTGSATLTLTINPASSGTGAVIGIDFDVGGASGQSPGSTAVAGPVPTAGWNNNVDLNNPPTAYVPYNPYNHSDTGTPLTLVDNTGATTTGTFGFNNYGFSTLNGGSTYSPGYGATGGANGGYTPDQQLYNGAAQAAYGGYVQQITLRNIPYAQFDVYVLATAYANVSGFFGEGSVQLFSGSASVTAGPTYYLGSEALAGTVPSSYVQATSTDQQNPTMGADYVRFSGLTGGAGTTYSFDLSAPNNASSSFNSAGAFVSAVEIVQIVSAPLPPTLNIQPAGANLQLTWTNSGCLLLQATNLAGPWITNAGAASPFTVTPTNPCAFYRLLAQ
jgi:hypothetical protein